MANLIALAIILPFLAPPPFCQDRAKLIIDTVAKDTGEAIPDVPVTLSWVVSLGDRLVARFSTNDEGSYELEVPADRAYRLIVDTNGMRDGRIAVLTPELIAGEEHAVTLALPFSREDHVIGRVVSKKQSAWIAGASVSIGRMQARTDDTGIFHAWVEPGESRSAVIEAENYTPVRIELAGGHDTVANAAVIPLFHLGVIKVAAVDSSGQPLGGVRVLVQPPPELAALRSLKRPLGEGDDGSRLDVTEMETGGCEFDEVPAGVPLQLRITRNQSVLQETTLTLDSGETRTLEVTVRAPGIIRGVLVDQDGHPVADARIGLDADPDDDQELAGGDSGVTRTDASGRFAFHDVSSGPWLVGPTGPGDTEIPPAADCFVRVAERARLGDGVNEVDLTLHVHRGLYIRGTVLTPGGEPQPRCRLWLISDDSLTDLEATSDADGGFVAGPLLPGRYRIHTRAKDDAVMGPGFARAAAGESGVVVRLTRGVDVNGVVRDGNEPCAAFLAFAPREQGGWCTGQAEEDGLYQVASLAPGLYDVLVQCEERGLATIVSGVRLEPGEKRTLDLALAPGAAVRITNDSDIEFLDLHVHLNGNEFLVCKDVPRQETATLYVPSSTLAIDIFPRGRHQLIERRSLTVVAPERYDLTYRAR
jgi:hypothetical protein